MIQILMDFKPILDLDLYSEHMAEERITGSKIDLDLSAELTYTRVYTVMITYFKENVFTSRYLLTQPSQIENLYFHSFILD